MVTFVPEFVSPRRPRGGSRRPRRPHEVGVDAKDWEAFGGFTATWQRGHPKPDATIEQVVAHLEHVREVAGIDHVGIGGDYDGTDTFPVGLEDVSGYPRLVAALLERSWSEADVATARAGQHAPGHARRRGGGPRPADDAGARACATFAELDG